jgi:O-antigen/teichoic acid export membrane protein
MTIILVALAVLVGLFGFVGTSAATAGVGVISWAFLLAIFARIAQAHEHDKHRAKEHEAVIKRLAAVNAATSNQ